MVFESNNAWLWKQSKSGRGDLHPSPDINVTTGNLCRAEEDVSAVATRAINPDGVLASVSGRGVESNLSTLVAVCRIGWPCCLVPSAFESFGDLAQGKGEKGKGEKSGLTEHLGGRSANNDR